MINGVQSLGTLQSTLYPIQLPRLARKQSFLGMFFHPPVKNGRWWNDCISRVLTIRFTKVYNVSQFARTLSYPLVHSFFCGFWVFDGSQTPPMSVGKVGLLSKMAEMGCFYVCFMDDWVVLAQTRWVLRWAIKATNQVLDDYQPGVRWVEGGEAPGLDFFLLCLFEGVSSSLSSSFFLRFPFLYFLLDFRPLVLYYAVRFYPFPLI